MGVILYWSHEFIIQMFVIWRFFNAYGVPFHSFTLLFFEYLPMYTLRGQN